jgi:hypothetical protein
MFIPKGFTKQFHIAQIRHLAEASAIAWRTSSIHGGFRELLAANSVLEQPWHVHFLGGVIFSSNKILIFPCNKALLSYPTHCILRIRVNEYFLKRLEKSKTLFNFCISKY